MSEAGLFLRELDEAVSRGTPESRRRALWHTTDLMIAGSYSDDEIWTFGEVIGRLADEIEVAARAQLAKRLARFDRAPVNIIHKLAFDDEIEVAGPVLRESERLEPYALIANVCLKGQTHMLAITQRKSIEESVTDVLVTRGDQEVVKSVVSNNGARLSEFGFLHMIQRAEGDSILAEQLGLRKDIPRHVFQQLIAKASDDVRKRLEHERPTMGEQIQSTVTDVAGELQSKFGPVSRSYYVAKRVVTTQHRQGNLNESSISRLRPVAQARRGHDRTVAAVRVAGRRDRTRRAGQEPGNAADPGQGARFFVGDDHGVAVSRRQGSPHHRQGAEQPGKANSAASTSRHRAASWNSIRRASMPGIPTPGAARQPALAMQ